MERGMLIELDACAAGNEVSAHGVAMGRRQTRLACERGRVDAKTLVDDGVEVCEFLDVIKFDVFDGSEGGADLLREFLKTIGVFEQIPSSACQNRGRRLATRGDEGCGIPVDFIAGHAAFFGVGGQDVRHEVWAGGFRSDAAFDFCGGEGAVVSILLFHFLGDEECEELLERREAEGCACFGDESNAAAEHCYPGHSFGISIRVFMGQKAQSGMT